MYHGRTRRRVGHGDRRVGGESDGNETVKSALGADVEFLRRGKEVAQGAALFVLGLAVEQRSGDAARGLVVGNGGGDGRLADAAFASARKDDEFGGGVHGDGVSFSSGWPGS